MNINYIDYFNTFQDIDQLKEAILIWVKQDIKRLNTLDKFIDEFYDLDVLRHPVTLDYLSKCHENLDKRITDYYKGKLWRIKKLE